MLVMVAVAFHEGHPEVTEIETSYYTLVPLPQGYQLNRWMTTTVWFNDYRVRWRGDLAAEKGHSLSREHHRHVALIGSGATSAGACRLACLP
jgi:hypothetical protein